MREKLCNGNNFNPILKNHKKVSIGILMLTLFAALKRNLMM